MSFPPNPNFDKFIYKSSDLRTNRPVKEQFIQVTDGGSFETFINSYLYKTVGNKYELLGDRKIVIQETDEVVITNKNGKIVKVIKDPVNSSEEKETIEVIEDGEVTIKTFTTLYYSYERKNNPESLCGNLIDVTTEFYLNRSLPSVFNFSINTDKIFTDQILRNTFNGNNQWFGVSRTRSTSSPEVIIQIGTDGTILEVFECPLPTEVSTDIRTVSINFEDPEKSIPVSSSVDDAVLPELFPDPGPPTVSATFNSDGGTQINPQSGFSPLYVSQPPDPTRANFIFNGFSPTLPAVITQDTVFTAIFTPEPPTIGFPVITTSNASSIKADSAVIGGNVINANNGPIESRGSVFREIIASSGSFISDTAISGSLFNSKIKPEPLQGVENPDTEEIWVYKGTDWIQDNRVDIDNNTGITSDGEGLGVFISELEGLNSGRKYIYRAYATNTGNNGEEQVSSGSLKEFRTTPLDVQTSVPFDITITSAKGGGLITNTGNLAILSRGVLLMSGSQTENTNFTLQNALDNPDSEIIVITDTGDLANSLFRLDLGELDPTKTQYTVKAYATNARGTGLGDPKLLTKPTGASPTVVNVGTPTKTATTITFQANLNSIGDAPVTQRGIIALEGGSGDPTFSNTSLFTTIGSGNVGLFTSTLTNLDNGSTYQVRAYATNQLGTGFSPTLSVTTETADLPTVILLSANPLRNLAGRGSGEVVSDGGAPVSSRGIRFIGSGPAVTVEVGTGVGQFVASGANLGSAGDVVDVEAFAVNSVGEQTSDRLPITLIN